MLGLTSGELFIVAFVTVTVVSAPWWLRAGEAIATMLSGVDPGQSDAGHAREGDE
jgi:hypothetical protein